MKDFSIAMTFALFSAGTINVTTAGALKATYKLLYAAEGVNVVGQGSFLLGAVMLHKAGLAEYKIPRKIVGESKYSL